MVVRYCMQDGKSLPRSVTIHHFVNIPFKLVTILPLKLKNPVFNNCL